MKSVLLATIVGCLALVPRAWADEPSSSSDDMSVLRRQVQQLTDTVQQLNATVQTQQQRINDLERANRQPTPGWW